MSSSTTQFGLNSGLLGTTYIAVGESSVHGSLWSLDMACYHSRLQERDDDSSWLFQTQLSTPSRTYNHTSLRNGFTI